MRPAWRLGINSLSARRSRTFLLICSVALCSALVTAVSCAMASLNAGVRQRVEATVGAADLRVQRVGKDVFDEKIAAMIGQWAEVAMVSPRLQGPITLKAAGKEVTTVGNGVTDAEMRVRPHELLQGRMPAAPGEVSLDDGAAEELGAAVGNEYEVIRFGDQVRLKVVGIVKRPPLGMLSRPESYVTLGQMQMLTERQGKVREIDVLLKPGVDADGLAKAKSSELAKGMILTTGSKVKSGLDKNMQSGQIGMTIASVLSFLAASFIIMTGLTTNVTERQRELAMLRCVGGFRRQLAESQLAIGFVIGAIGALAGTPLGMAASALLVAIFPEQLPGGFAVNPLGLGLSLFGSVVAGLIGAAWPAYRAARTSPLEALAIRSKPATVRGLLVCAGAGLALEAIHIAIIAAPTSADVKFWSDMTVGIPACFTGYFLLSVPVTVLVAMIASGTISVMLRLPRGLLRRAVQATPYRFGFTAGAMMMGLALLVSLWTNGRAITRDWLGSLQFPDAFVSGISLSQRTEDRIKALPFVLDTCAVTVQNFKSEVFGIKAFDNTNTSFVAFEPDPFFRMTKLTWIEGDPLEAQRRLNAGGAVIVASEYKIAGGKGLGSRVSVPWNGKVHEFEVVGVVSSPGLDIASKFFDIGDEYLDQAVNAVFGSRSDLKRITGNEGVQLIQLTLDPKVDTKTALNEVRKQGGFEIVAAGSGREIKEEIKGVLGRSFLVMSIVAIGAMLVASFGVANLIVAGIQGRQYEFGVLRAIGAERGTIARMVLGEAMLVAITACIVGTVMGMQAAWAGKVMYESVLGLVLSVRLPLGPTAAGWAATAAITIGAAVPAVMALSRRHPRELLGALRG